MCVIFHEAATLYETASCSQNSCTLKLPLFQAMTVISAYNILYPGRREYWLVPEPLLESHCCLSVDKSPSPGVPKDCTPIQASNKPLGTLNNVQAADRTPPLLPGFNAGRICGSTHTVNAKWEAAEWTVPHSPCCFSHPYRWLKLNMAKRLMTPQGARRTWEA